jgi:hypothetical protein
MEAELEASLFGDLLRTLELHNRLRFDPEGLDDRERTQLRDGARRLVEAVAAGRRADGVVDGGLTSRA